MGKQKVIAYCYSRYLKDMTETDIKCLDAIHIAFGRILEGEVYWKRESTSQDISRIRSIHPGIKIILSIGGWGADGFSQAAAAKEGRELFASTAIACMKEEGLDGLDIDWEYPCSDIAGIAADPADKENFTLLLEELRVQLDACEEYKSLSIAAGALESCVKTTNMNEAVKYLDYVQLMTYDFHGSLSEKTGHLANLYKSMSEPEAPSADEAVHLFVKAGVPIEKIVMGAAFYGKIWSNVPNENHGLAQAAKTAEDDSRSYAQIDQLAKTSEEGFERFWDEEAKAVTLYNGEEFISYEDKEALSYKAEYVKTNKMYGVMYWEYGLDDSRTLTQYLYNELNK